MTDALLARLTYTAPDAELAPIPWPEGLAPAPINYDATPLTPLPRADVLVVTWTAAEWQALADVLTPGHPSTSWLRYAENWATFEPQLTWKSPAREANCLADYALTQIGSKRVLCVHSQLHLATDAVSAPIVALWEQMIAEVEPDLVITTGTAGGIGVATVLGDVFICGSAKFNCTKAFASKPWAQERFTQDPPSIGLQVSSANAKLIPINAKRLPAELTPHAPTIWASTGDVETVDYFAFSDTDDSYGVVKNDPAAHTEEMDDATLPLALSQMGSSTPWLSIRNASDPEVASSIGSLEEQSKWASQIYEKWGYTTTIGSAIACWAVIADLEAS